jgi:subtilase family serine protease
MAFRYLMRGLALAPFWLLPAVASAGPLVTAPIDETRLVTLAGNTRPEVGIARDLGALAPDFRLDHLQLELRRSPAAERQVEEFVNSLTDPESPNYHRWLGAEEFGSRFGTDPADLRVVTAWLTDHGFTVESIPDGRMAIDFSGTAAQVAATFHTEIHRIESQGREHIANIRDPEIPATLAPLVVGIASLHDFRAQKKFRPRPDFTSSTGCSGPCYALAPGDLQTIYHMSSVYAGGITGDGQTIAVVEDTNLYTNADFNTFRTRFGLAAKYPTSSLVVTHPAPTSGANNCRNPGVNSNGDDVEAAVDAEWASAAAPGATIELASCDNTKTSDGIFLAIQNLVNAASPPPIISISYGYCEAENGASYNAAFDTLYQQAAAEGISIFVSTGDDGPSDCAVSGKDTPYGIGINAWAASQYDVAVGGTDFSDVYAGTTAKYWKSKSSTTGESAISYVPEMTWNDSCASTILAAYVSGSGVTYGSKGFCNSKLGAPFLSLGGGEGGPSGCFYGNPAAQGYVGGTCRGYAKPSWQKGLFGNPADGVRDIPDVSMFAADGVWQHYYLLCFSDPNNSGTPCGADLVNWAGGGGTSYAAPILAGVQALVNQKLKAAQGNPNPVYYRLAAAEYGTKGNTGCSANLGTSVGAGCVFNDVTQGVTSQPCTLPHNCYHPSGTYGVLSVTDGTYAVAYGAQPGWDFATGIGTVNVANLVAKWGSVAP